MSYNYDDVSKYALDHMDLSLREQYKEVESIRLRSSFLIAANSLSATFFAQLFPENFLPEITLIIAIAFFILSNVFALFVMSPVGYWSIVKNPNKLLNEYVSKQDMDKTRIYGVLAIKAYEDLCETEKLVRTTMVVFGLALIATIISIVSFSLYTWNCYF